MPVSTSSSVCTATEAVASLLLDPLGRLVRHGQVLPQGRPPLSASGQGNEGRSERRSGHPSTLRDPCTLTPASRSLSSSVLALLPPHFTPGQLHEQLRCGVFVLQISRNCPPRSATCPSLDIAFLRLATIQVTRSLGRHSTLCNSHRHRFTQPTPT